MNFSTRRAYGLILALITYPLMLTAFGLPVMPMLAPKNLAGCAIVLFAVLNFAQALAATRRRVLTVTLFGVNIAMLVLVAVAGAISIQTAWTFGSVVPIVLLWSMWIKLLKLLNRIGTRDVPDWDDVGLNLIRT